MSVGFRPIPVRSEHRRKKWAPGPFRAHFCADRLAVEFSPRTDPIHSVGPQDHVGACSGDTCSVGALVRQTVLGGLFRPTFVPTDMLLDFSPRTDPIHSIGPQTHAGGFSSDSGSV